jgi:hypothetical protein
MAEQKELSLADSIVAQVTTPPTIGESRRKTKGLMAQDEQRISSEGIPTRPEDMLPSYVQTMIETIREERTPLAQETEEYLAMKTDDLGVEGGIPDEITRPRSYSDVISTLKQPEKAENLKENASFMARLERMKEKFPGLSEREVFKVIEGESSYNPKAISSAGAVGLFQMMPETLAELGFTPSEVLDMEPTEQLAVYESYLKRWDYDGSSGLGIIQAAPAFRNASPDTIVYRKGTAAWKQNPGWRERGNGHITKRSIEAYYGRVE